MKTKGRAPGFGDIWRIHHLKWGLWTYLCVYALPLTAGTILAFQHVLADNEILTAIATAISVFGALLFGLLIPVFDRARNCQDRMKALSPRGLADNLTGQRKHEYKLVEAQFVIFERIFISACFCIILSLFGVFWSLIILYYLKMWSAAITNRSGSPYLLFQIGNAFLFAFVLVFIFSVFLLLQRLYRSMLRDLDEAEL